MNDTSQHSSREIVINIYKKYNPSKLDSVDSLLKKYKGKESKLIAALRKKYRTIPSDDNDEKTTTSDLKKDKAWTEFQAFAKSVSLSVPEKDEEEEEEEENRTKFLEEIEQTKFLERVESIKRKRLDNHGIVVVETKKNSSSHNIETDTMILSMLRNRKEKRKRRRVNASSTLDLLDWRTKSTV